jgi:hypothetical protein
VTSMRLFLACLLLVLAPALVRADGLTARTIIERATEAAGGETWRRPETLFLSGYGVFWPRGTQESRVVNERHEMWRVFPRESPDAHVANGKVRIDGWRGGRILFQQSFDGVQSYTQAGPTGGAADSSEWRENFGFGIFRFALDEGATLTRLPDDSVENRPVYLVRVSDRAGGDTIFGIDKENFRILKAGFQTPRGWHERIYSDFVEQQNPRWVQPMRVRLFYNGVKQNEIVWQTFAVNQPIPDAAFRLPAPRPQ